MHALALLRRRGGLSQRELARRAGVAYKTVQLIEAGAHDVRASTLEKLARALGLAGSRALEEPPGRMTARQAASLLQEGAIMAPLLQFIDDFRRDGPATAAHAPEPDTGPRALALVASTTEALCAERDIPPPWWCGGAPALPRPWFLAGMESLKASALVESPPLFRKRNLFVLGNFLSRA